MSRGCTSRSLRNTEKNDSTNGKPRKATINHGTNHQQQTRRANQDLILQISCDISMTWKRKDGTQVQMGEQLVFIEARKNDWPYVC